MRPAHTPSSVKGSISKCVVSLQRKEVGKEAVKPEPPLVSASYQENHVTSLVNHVFIEGDLTVVLLIDIQVLHQAFMQKVFKVSAGNSWDLSL